MQFGNITCNGMEGSLVDFVMILARRLQFRTCFVFPADLQYGNFDARTSKGWGMVGMAARREVQMIITALTPSFSRAQGIDFSFPFQSEPSAIIIRRRLPSIPLFRVLAPFNWDAWLGVSAALVLTGLIGAILSKISPMSGRNLQMQCSVRDEVRSFHSERFRS